MPTLELRKAGRQHHTFKLNGIYSSLTVPSVAIDSLFLFEKNYSIIDVAFIREIAGSSGTTQIDIEILPPSSSTWTSIFSTKPSCTSAAGNNANIRKGQTKPNMTAPVLTADPLQVQAGSLMRMRILQKEAGNPDSVTCHIYFE